MTGYVLLISLRMDADARSARNMLTARRRARCVLSMIMRGRWYPSHYHCIRIVHAFAQSCSQTTHSSCKIIFFWILLKFSVLVKTHPANWTLMQYVFLSITGCFPQNRATTHLAGSEYPSLANLAQHLFTIFISCLRPYAPSALTASYCFFV